MKGVDFTVWSDDSLDRFLTGIETRIGTLRALQAGALREVDRRQTPLADGCRSLGEWVTGRLDVSADTAKTLVATARRLQACPTVEQAAGDGELSFDRTAAVARLAVATGSDETTVLEQVAGMDVAGIHRHTAKQRRRSADAEQGRFRDRYCTTQFNLDHTGLRFHGEVFGVAARHIDAALHHVGDTLPTGPEPATRATRNADALWKICQDALDTTNGDHVAVGSQVTVFVDATPAAATGTETGVVIEAGPRVGPNTLQAILCDSIVEVTAVTDDATPLNMGRRSRLVSPQLRRFTIHRDGGACTAEGCQSRYRLQTHHITPWSQGGTTNADNLTTLCWYHHHVVVHGNGYHIDPTSPPQRRRFLPPHNHDPP